MMPTTLQDYVALAQSAAITLAFLYAVYSAPGLIRDYFASCERAKDKEYQESEKARLHELDKDEKDREARHRASEGYQKALADMMISHRGDIKEMVGGLDRMSQAMHEMALAQKGVCVYRGACEEK